VNLFFLKGAEGVGGGELWCRYHNLYLTGTLDAYNHYFFSDCACLRNELNSSVVGSQSLNLNIEDWTACSSVVLTKTKSSKKELH